MTSNSTIITFGKHINKTYQNVVDSDISYCKWIIKQQDSDNSNFNLFKQFYLSLSTNSNNIIDILKKSKKLKIPKKQQKQYDIIEQFNKNNIIVFTDGSCTKNGQIDSFGGIGLFVPFNKEYKNMSIQYKQEYCQNTPSTNQKTELLAVILALQVTKSDNRHLCIYSDSMYVINIVTNWGWKWRKDGLIKQNMCLVNTLLDLISDRKKELNDQPDFLHIYSHLDNLQSNHLDLINLKFNDTNEISNQSTFITYCNHIADQLASSTVLYESSDLLIHL